MSVIRPQRFDRGDTWEKAAPRLNELVNDVQQASSQLNTRINDTRRAADDVRSALENSPLVLANLRLTDLNQWNNAGTTSHSSSNVGTGTAPTIAVVSSGGRYKHRVSGSHTSGSGGHAAFLFRPGITLPNRYMVWIRVSGGTVSSGSGLFGAMLLSNTATASNHYAICTQIAPTGTTIATRRIEGGAIAAGTARGSGLGNATATPGVTSKHTVEIFANPVVTSPVFSYISENSSQGASSNCSEQSEADFSAFSGSWNNLNVNNVGVCLVWTTAATQTYQFDIEQFSVLKHPLDW